MRKTTSILFTVAALLTGAAMTGSAIARDRSDPVELTASQITDQAAARAAQMKADLRLTSDQEKNWSGFETAVVDMWKKQAEHQVAWRKAHATEQGSANLIDDMRKGADDQIEQGNDRKKLADAAQPLYASLDDQQKRRFSEAMFRRDRDRRSY
jgi:LTXXQ motif family protein